MRHLSILKIAVYANVLSGFLVTGCSSDEMDFYESPEDVVDLAKRSDEIVNQNDALKVALKFKICNESNYSRSNADAKVSALTSDDGDGLIYVVNFADNRGYVVLSADKRYQPILAFSDEGYFDESLIDCSGASYWLKNVTSYLQDGILSENEIRTNKAMWNAYLSEVNHTSGSRSNENVTDLLNSAIQEWTKNGWKYYEAKYHYDNAVHSSLPLDLLDDLKQIGDNKSNYYLTGRPLIEDTYIVEWTDKTTTSDTKNILTTKWGQSYPYNIVLRANFPYTNYIGCSAVVCGQILKHKSDLSSYDFSKMPDVATYSNCNEVARFLFDIGTEIGIAYRDTLSSATIYQTRDAMRHWGYKNSTVKSCTFESLLDYSYPIYVRGTDVSSNEKDSGHAWVVDGNTVERYVTHYMIMVPNEHPEDAMGGPYVPYQWNYAGYTNTSTSKYLHCNWGWDGYCDGYFRYFVAGGYNYTKDFYCLEIK